MEFDKKCCPILDVDGVIAGGKQFDLDITLPEDNRNVIYGVIKDCYKEPICDAVVKLIEVCGDERKPVSHTFTDKEGEFVFGPLCPDKFYEINFWVDRVKHIKVCARCEHEGKCLKGEKMDKCDCFVKEHKHDDCKKYNDYKKYEDYKKDDDYKKHDEYKKYDEYKKDDECKKYDEYKKDDEYKKYDEYKKDDECKKYDEYKKDDECKKHDEYKKDDECKKHDEYKKDDECKKHDEYKKDDECKKYDDECKCHKIFEDKLEDLLITEIKDEKKNCKKCGR